MTIIEELEQIAKACKTSEEFTNRAKVYLTQCKGFKQPIMTDSQIRDIFRRVEKERIKKEAWGKYDKVIDPALKKMWFKTFRFLGDEEIVEACAKYLNEQERFYSSPDYYDMLNNLIKDI